MVAVLTSLIKSRALLDEQEVPLMLVGLNLLPSTPIISSARESS